MAKAAPRAERGRRAPEARGLTLRDQQREFTRQRLLDLGRAELEERGYAATKVEDIAAAAGASRATFYLHFASKQELVEAIWETVDPDFRTRYEELDAYLSTTRRPSRAMLRAWLEKAFAFWLENARFVDVLRQSHIVESGDGDVDDFSLATDLVGSMTRWLHRSGADPEISRQRAVMVERMTAHLFEEVSLRRYRLDVDVTLDLLVDVWWTVFRPQGR